MLSTLQKKLFALIICFISDATIFSWLYFKASHYGNFSDFTSPYVTSPNYQLELYTIFLQSFTFLLLLAFFTQAIVYVLALRNIKASYFYLKFYCVFAFAITVVIAFKSSVFALVPGVFYLYGYYIFAFNYSELKAKAQIPLQETTPQ